MEPVEWADDNPYFLLLVAFGANEAGEREFLILDVGKSGWMTIHADWLRRPAEWYLCEKAGERRVVATQIVYTGDQPYYVKRHVGQIGMASGEGRALVVHGIGKKVPAVYREGKTKRSKVLVSSERTDRIWILPSGAVCGGEDVEAIALAALSMMEWQPG